MGKFWCLVQRSAAMSVFGILGLMNAGIIAGPMEFYIRRKIESEKNAFSDTSSIQRKVSEGVYQQKLNPQDVADTRTFAQRYFVDTTFSENENSPVFLYICGEATCSGAELSGFIQNLAEKFKGSMVALEHRYYGKSQPFAQFTNTNLQYLSTANALADLASFQTYAQQNLGLKGKWVAVGGSYAGSLAAFYRLKYPNLIVGALASSGPVQAKPDFEEYDLTIDQVAGPVCADAIRRSVKRIEQSLSDPALKIAMKMKFDAVGVREDIDFLYVVADMAAFAIQYGSRDFFCDQILQAQDELDGYAKAGITLFQRFGITAIQDSFQAAESLDPNDYLSTFGMRQWMYQSCTEYGYWQIAYHDPAHSTRSALIDQKYHDSVCDRLFGIKTPVDTQKTNAAFYQNLLDEKQASRILFTDGSTDPWAKLSITHELGNVTNPMTEAITIQGAAHCDDLSSMAQSTGEVNKAQKRLIELVEVWLQ